MQIFFSLSNQKIIHFLNHHFDSGLVLEENEKRVKENPEYYKLRQQITEHQFGTLKRQWGFTYTLMKGKENVLSEVNLMMMVYNLRRLMSIFNLNELKTRIKSFVFNILTKYKPKRAVLRHFNFLFEKPELKYSILFSRLNAAI